MRSWHLDCWWAREWLLMKLKNSQLWCLSCTFVDMAALNSSNLGSPLGLNVIYNKFNRLIAGKWSIQWAGRSSRCSKFRDSIRGDLASRALRSFLSCFDGIGQFLERHSWPFIWRFFFARGCWFSLTLATASELLVWHHRFWESCETVSASRTLYRQWFEPVDRISTHSRIGGISIFYLKQIRLRFTNTFVIRSFILFINTPHHSLVIYSQETFVSMSCNAATVQLRSLFNSGNIICMRHFISVTGPVRTA